ncbi:hypothetical protein Tco_0897321 [Tanacetum coccineum]
MKQKEQECQSQVDFVRKIFGMLLDSSSYSSQPQAKFQYSKKKISLFVLLKLHNLLGVGDQRPLGLIVDEDIHGRSGFRDWPGLDYQRPFQSSTHLQLQDGAFNFWDKDSKQRLKIKKPSKKDTVSCTGLDEPSSRKRNQRNKPRENKNIVYTEDEYEYEDEDEYVDGDEVEDEDDHVGSWRNPYFFSRNATRVLCNPTSAFRSVDASSDQARHKKLMWDELLPRSEADKIRMMRKQLKKSDIGTLEQRLHQNVCWLIQVAYL